MKNYRITSELGMGTVKFFRVIFLFILSSSLVASSLVEKSSVNHEHKQWKTSLVRLKNNDVLRGYVTVKNGLVVPLRGEATLDINGTIDRMLDFNNGTIVLDHDLTLGSAIEFRHDGSIAGNGYVVSMSSDLCLNDSLTFVTDTIIDGRGSAITFNGNGALVINDNVQLTLKNVQINDLMAKRIVFGGSNATLKVQNSTLNLSGEMTIDQGNFIVSGKVGVFGPYKFNLNSLQPTQICKHSELTINSEVILRYNPGGNVFHDLRSLISMEANTSVLRCNGCTLDLPPSGLRLIRGRLIFENKVLINNYGNEDILKSFQWGDGTITNDLHVVLNAGARLEVDGCIHAKT